MISNYFRMFGKIGEELNNEFIKSLKLEKEEVVFERNGIRTIITVYFYPNGVIASTTSISNPIKSEIESKRELLTKQIQEAVRKEEYDLAAKLKKEKDSL